MAMNARLKPWLLAVATALPFQMLLLIDWLCFGSAATGFIMNEMPYYAANGRAYFDHGNIITHPNPYDPTGPSIYFQLSTWLIGAFNWVTGIDPGVGIALLGILFSILTARVTYELVRERLPEASSLTTAFILVMFSGGVLVARVAIEMLLRAIFGKAIGDGDLLRYDPSAGWWFLNWGRNLVMTTEAMYHFLMASAWLAFLRKQMLRGTVFTALVALAHPWTGVIALGILAAWIVVTFIRERAALDWRAVTLALAMAAAFGWYYGVFLNQFPEHRAISEDWTLAWTLSWEVMIYSLLPPLILLAFYAWKRPTIGRQEIFLGICFFISMALSKHELFMQPIQPLHFNRAYPWLAIVLMAMPAFPSLLAKVKRAGVLVSGFVVLLLVSDNIGFFYMKAKERASDDPKNSMILAPEIKQLFEYADENGLRGILLCQDSMAMYAAPAYTSLHAYVGHDHLTPNYHAKLRQTQEFFAGRDSTLLDSVDYLLKSSSVDLIGVYPMTARGSYTLYRVAR
jgi:hypothetical protein